MALTKLHNRMIEGSMVNIIDFGAVGDGSTNDASAIQAAVNTGSPILFPSGTYQIDSSIIFDVPVHVEDGATIKPRSSSSLVFEEGLYAGWYKIFDVEDDLTTVDDDFVNDVSVKIQNVAVKADWFCDKVLSSDDILTISDQTNAMRVAFRAAAGDFISSGSDFVNEYKNGVLELGSGFYRIDGLFRMSTIISGTYYRLNGFRFSGQGSAASYLLRTDMSSTDILLYCLYTAELTTMYGFKISAFNPDGATSAEKFSSATRAMMFLQGDSLHLRNIWVSGAQTSVTDANGYERNGVGIQFNSCVDTYMTDVFVELCSTGIGFGSSVVSGTNIEVYSTYNYGIVLGNMVSTWPDTQTTGSKIYLSNVQFPAIQNTAVLVFEEGSAQGATFRLNNGYFDGYNSQVGINFGTHFMRMKSGTQIKGSITNVDIENFTARTFSADGANCLFGTLDASMAIENCKVVGQTAQATGSSTYSIFDLNETGMFVNAFVSNLSLKDVRCTLFKVGTGDGQITFRDVYLSDYIGEADTSSNRQLGNGSGTIRLVNFERNVNDTTALNQFAFWSSGEIYVDIRNLYNATRSIGGSSTEVMPSTTTFS